MKKTIIVLAGVLVAAACAQKEMDYQGSADTVRFKAILEGVDPSTKTYLGAEEDGLYPVYWSEGDKIKMFVSQHETSDGQGYQLDLESGAGTVESVFSGSVPVLPDGSLYYYAVYPYSLGASVGGSENWYSDFSEAEYTYDDWECANYLEIPLPSVQVYSPHSFGRDYNPAIAVSRDQTLRFKNTCGLLRINLTGNVKVGKITVKGDSGAALWGTLRARYRWRQHSAESEFIAIVVNHQSSDNYFDRDRTLLTLDCGEGVQLSNTVTDFYLVIPIIGNFYNIYYGGDFIALEQGFTLRIYDTEGNEVYAKHTERDNSIHRSMIRNMPVLDVRRQVLTDLSANGTANSYIVSPDGGTYRFFAGNRGNSPQPVHDNGAGSLRHAAAQVLWETKMSGTEETALHDIIDNVTYDYETQYISFSTTSNPGNALIALKDAADNVLWSWHIWSTDYNPDASGSTDSYGSVTMMDRNLGALTKDATEDGFSGMWYEWGRKDPFDWDLKYKYYPSMPFARESGTKTLEELTRIPTTYIYGRGNRGNMYNDTNECEMYAPDITKLWGKEKTMYDPCPPGWQVADFDTYYQFARNFSSPAFNLTDNGDYAQFNHSTPAAVYPKEDVWTNLHHFTYWGAICFQLSAFGRGHGSCNLKHVRCQRSDTPIELRPVTDLSAAGTANCYMARPKGKYKFNASVKGNSGISVGLPDNANILVYTENTTEIHGDQYGGLKMENGLITDCYLKDGYIYFTTSLDDIYGNAIIYLTDPHGHILWSWHIWIVDYNPESNYDVVDWGEAGNKKFMKMNLGALNNTMNDSRAMGMMYQWGRKDPFMGAVAYDSNTQAIYEGEYGSVEASSENSTLLYSLRSPNKAIMDEADGDGDWLLEHENALWGAEKTMYDPCPRGWKVPSRPVFNEHSVSSQFQYGMRMDDIWYPATGYHHSVSFNLNQVGREGHYWYSTPKDDGNAYSFFFNSDNQTVDLANHASPKAQLNAIRCMKDE